MESWARCRQSTQWPSALISPLWASAAVCGACTGERGHHSFQSAYEYLYSSFKQGSPTTQRKKHYFPFAPKFEDTQKRGKSLRKIGQVEQERLYFVPFMNIYRQFPSRVQPPSQELYIKGKVSCCVTRSHQFLLFLRRNQLTCVPSQLNTYKPDHM